MFLRCDARSASAKTDGVKEPWTQTSPTSRELQIEPEADYIW